MPLDFAISLASCARRKYGANPRESMHDSSLLSRALISSASGPLLPFLYRLLAPATVSPSNVFPAVLPGGKIACGMWTAPERLTPPAHRPASPAAFARASG